MNIIYLLLPLALIIAALLIWLFLWAIKSNQFDDLEGPAYKILMDDDKSQTQKNTPKKNITSDTPLTPSSSDKTPEKISEQISGQASKQPSDKNRD